MKYTNKHNINTFSAIWLLDSSYNNGQNLYPGKELISATTLLKPTRQTVIKKQIDLSDLQIDISDLVSSRVGSAVHDSVEKTWRSEHLYNLLQMYGYTDEESKAFIIDPNPKNVQDHNIPIYLERRFFKELNGYIISGQVDAIFDGQLIDVKNTSTFTYTSIKAATEEKSSKEEDYILQGSIYRWLAPELITRDTICIDYKFSDWTRNRVGKQEHYPVTKSLSEHYNLLSIEATEQFILNKIEEIEYNKKLSQSDMIRCTKKDLWQSEPTYKYYTDPNKANLPGSRSTKNFTDFLEAHQHLKEMGKGIIKTVESEPKACLYCPVYDFCEQRKEYFNDND
jgi:hypothetical protein